MVKNVVRASKVLALVPLLFLLTSCFDYSLTGSPSREKLLGTWVAEELPGAPSMTFVDAPTLDTETGDRRKDGRIELEGWPIEVFDRDALVSAESASWSTPRDWTGTWTLQASGLFLGIRENSTASVDEDPMGTGATLDIYDSLFSDSCMNVYFARDENVAPTKMCKTT